MKGSKPQVACPTCRKPVVWGEESPWRPFCSKRCRLIDLGDWLNEDNRIPGSTDEFPLIDPDELNQ